MRFKAAALAALTALLACPFSAAFGIIGSGIRAGGARRRYLGPLPPSSRAAARRGRPPPSLALPSSPRSDDGGGNAGANDSSDDDDDEGSSSADWMSGGPLRPDSAERKRKRDQLRDFFSASPKSAGAEPVRPFDPSGNEIVDPEPPARTVRPKFDALFGDGRMPGLDDILGGAREEAGGSGGGAGSDDSIPIGAEAAFDVEGAAEEDNDDDHHPDDVAVADRSFASFAASMNARIAEQRAADPDSVPDNAEQFLEGVVAEMRMQKLSELKEERRRKDMKEYELRRLEEMEDRVRGLGRGVGDDVADAVVREVLGEAEDEASQKKQYEGKVEVFREYEQRKLKEAEAKAAASAAGGEGGEPLDPDEQALRLMEDLLARRTAEEEEFERRLSEATGDDYDIPEWDTDNLEDGIAELKRSIEAKKDAEAKGQERVRPETMKEWQMYRSIASKMTSEPGGAPSSSAETDNAADVADKLRGWREFQQREEEMRRSAGLTKGARMPFAWSDRGEGPPPPDEAEAETKGAAVGGGGNSGPPAFEQDPDRVRLEYDRTALRVLRDLAESTYDEYRTDKLRQEIVELEAEIAELEEKIRNKPPPEVKAKEEEPPSAPVDVSDIFGGGKSIFGEEDGAGAGAAAAAGTAKEGELEPPPPPPDSPFFSDSFEEDAYVDEELPSVPEPDTPFFRDDVAAEDEIPDEAGEAGSSDDQDEVKSLGSIEEQKLRSMARRKGIRSQAEEEKLRREWEEFQKFESSRRDRAGLSGGVEDPNVRAGTKMDYDIGEVVQGGDVDADKILESIGERPSKRRKTEGGAETAGAGGVTVPAEDGSYEQYLRYEQEQMEKTAREQEQKEEVPPSEGGGLDDDEKEDVIVYQKHATRWDKTSVSDQLYRSLASRGRGAQDDPEGKAAFEEYLRKEEEMRRAVESGEMPPAAAGGANAAGTEDLESVEAMEDYAEDVLEELGPRPAPKRSREDYTRDYSTSAELVDEEEDDDDGDESAAGSMRESTYGMTPKTSSDQLPDWVRREQEEQRQEEFAVTDDDEDYAAAGYDDEQLDDLDYEEKQRQAEEFERKTSGGTPREVSLSDIFGRDYFGPDDEPDDDYSLTKGRGGGAGDSAFSSFERRKRDLLDYGELSVAELNSLMDYRDEDSGGASRYMKKVRKPYREFGAVFRLEQLLVDVTGLNREAWRRTAEKYEFDMPELENVRVAAAHRAEFAVQRVFYWTDNFMEGREIARTQREMIAEVFGEWIAEQGIEHKPTEKAKQPGSFDIDLGLGDGSDEEGGNNAAMAESAPVGTDEDLMGSAAAPEETGDVAPVAPSESEFLAMQLEAWTKAAEYFSLQPPTEKDVEATTFLSAEDVVTKLFQWTDDASRCKEIVVSYRASLKVATDRWAARHSPEDLTTIKAEKKEEPAAVEGTAAEDQDSAGGGLSEDDMLEMQLFSWTAAAEANGYGSPSLEGVQMASWVSPEEAVRKVFKWTEDDEVIAKVASAQRDAMKKISEIYIKKKNLKVQQADASGSASEQDDKPAAPTEEDVLKLQVDVWSEVARRNSFSAPNVDEVQLATFGSPDEAVIRVFKWTDDIEKSQEIAAVHREVMEQMSKEFLQRFNQGRAQPGAEVNVAGGSESSDEVSLPLFVLNDGAVEWLQTLKEVEMPCAVLSHLDRREVDVILDRTGLSRFFPPERRVTVANAYRGEINELLGAALRLERRPDHCAVFDVTPGSAVAAHENGMQSVAMIGLYANYDLLAADMTAKYFDQFRVQNLRGLFSDVKLDEPQEELQQSLPEAPKPLKTRFWEEGDRS